MIDLILKDIEDKYSRENFSRLSNFIKEQVFFDGDFSLFEVSIPAASDEFEVPHGLTFIPKDIILLAVEGNFNYFFRYQEFTKTSIFITADGPVRLRFLAGRLSSTAGLAGGASEPFTLIPPEGTEGAIDDEVDQHLNILRILADSTYITELTRLVRVIDVQGEDDISIILGTYRVAATGVTTLTAGATLRIAS